MKPLGPSNDAVPADELAYAKYLVRLNTYHREYYRKNAVVHKTRAKAWKAANRERRRAANRRWSARNRPLFWNFSADGGALIASGSMNGPLSGGYQTETGWWQYSASTTGVARTRSPMPTGRW
jgi:hypothetical protein